MKVSDNFTQESAIRDALRLNTKWLIISESRGRDILRVLEGASSGCVALTSIHAENVWEIPDRILNMAGEKSRIGLENDIYTFFDYAIKVKAQYTKEGIKRNIDQICFFDRLNKENVITTLIKDGKIQKAVLPDRILKKFISNKENDFLNKYIDVLKRKQDENKKDS